MLRAMPLRWIWLVPPEIVASQIKPRGADQNLARTASATSSGLRSIKASP